MKIRLLENLFHNIMVRAELYNPVRIITVSYLGQVVVGTRVRLQVKLGKLFPCHPIQHTVEDVVVPLSFQLHI